MKRAPLSFEFKFNHIHNLLLLPNPVHQLLPSTSTYNFSFRTRHTNPKMASRQMQASKVLKKKGSPTIRLIQELIEENPNFEEKLEELKVSVSLAEKRNAQLLEEKEDLILDLQGTALKDT